MENEILKTTCSICSTLSDQETASQKFGWEELDTHLPDAVSQLTVIKDLKPGNFRNSELLMCPMCKTFYLYSSDYEYLVNGSEDEQTLTRLTSEEADKYNSQPYED